MASGQDRTDGRDDKTSFRSVSIVTHNIAPSGGGEEEIKGANVLRPRTVAGWGWDWG